MHMIIRNGPRNGAATRRTPPARPSTRAPSPLDVVYAQAGTSAPRTRPIPSERIPSPYRAIRIDLPAFDPRVDSRKVGDIVEILPRV